MMHASVPYAVTRADIICLDRSSPVPAINIYLTKCYQVMGISLTYTAVVLIALLTGASEDAIGGLVMYMADYLFPPTQPRNTIRSNYVKRTSFSRTLPVYMRTVEEEKGDRNNADGRRRNLKM